MAAVENSLGRDEFAKRVHGHCDLIASHQDCLVGFAVKRLNGWRGVVDQGLVVRFEVVVRLMTEFRFILRN
jgi:hypothetical protein